MTMRFASFNVDLQAANFNGVQSHNEDIARFLENVDVVAFQELGSWDVPLTEEPCLSALAC